MKISSTSVWVTTTTAASPNAGGSASTRGRTTSELRVAPEKTTARAAAGGCPPSFATPIPTGTMISGKAIYRGMT